MTQATARHILVDTEEQCLQLKTDIENGADFAAVARDHSNCPSSRDGGNLGSFGRGQMVPEFDTVVFGAPVGVVGVSRKSAWVQIPENSRCNTRRRRWALM